jgi:hypothetical protein
MTRSRARHRLSVVLLTATLLIVVVAPAEASAPSPSGTTCWQKRAYYQARNPGLQQTLGSGTRYSEPCMLDSYLAIERATAEFGVTDYTDALVRIAACESHLLPRIVGMSDRADVGLFQWNDKPPRHWWTTVRALFNAWQDRKAKASHGTYAPRYASNDRYDPYNSARVAAWTVIAFPRSWQVTWICKGVYDRSLGRLR